MSHQFDYTDQPTPEEIDIIGKGISAADQSKNIPSRNMRHLGIYIRDEQNNIIAGLTAKTRWNWFYVDLLWVSEALKGTGAGKALLTEAEQKAKAMGCDKMGLDTFSFQARGFYEKMGFKVIATWPNYPEDHENYFLEKDIN
jgi:ribosomal protein S18 acetylase RimI-like enzyme